MQGKAALHDLVSCAGISRVVVVDNREDIQADLHRYPATKVSGHVLDAHDVARMAAFMRDADVVIEALPSIFALPMGRLAAECGVSLVSSMYYLNPGEQDAEKISSIKAQIGQIDQKAKAQGIVILTEFGLDPGLDLICGAKAISELDEVHEFYNYGAGIPCPDARANPLQYKFSWSIIGVMKAYRRPARIITRGKIMEIDPARVFEAGNCHMLDLAEIGSPLECFPNGDSVHYADLFGIRESVKEMGRYTCRWPGHCAFWDTLSKCGFLDQEPVRIGGVAVTPIEFTAALLGSQEQFFYLEGEKDLALVRIDARGIRQGKKTEIIYQLVDKRDLQTGFTAMQRTVGFTLSLGAQLILGGKLGQTGLLTPLDVRYECVIPTLRKHNINFVRTEGQSDE